jgi:hypothetical protein
MNKVTVSRRLRIRKLKKFAPYNVMLFFAGYEPVFLPFHRYSAVVEKCEQDKRFSESESFNAAFDFHPQDRKRVYDSVCRYLEEEKEKSEYIFAKKFQEFQLFDFDARDNASMIFNAVMLLYPQFYIEFKKGNPDIRFPYGFVFDICIEKECSSMKYLVCIHDIEQIRATGIDDFEISFVDGKTLHFSNGDVHVY